MFYPNVTKLVANEIKIFVKLSATTELFRDKLPDTPFPPNSSNYILGNFIGCHSVRHRKLLNILSCGK
jgi:hypothetical protein